MLAVTRPAGAARLFLWTQANSILSTAVAIFVPAQTLKKSIPSAWRGF
jgi:hypothetical protein